MDLDKVSKGLEEVAEAETEAVAEEVAVAVIMGAMEVKTTNHLRRIRRVKRRKRHVGEMVVVVEVGAAMEAEEILIKQDSMVSHLQRTLMINGRKSAPRSFSNPAPVFPDSIPGSTL